MLSLYLLIIAQIVLESFPISSSTHVALLELFLSRCGFDMPQHMLSFDGLPFGSLSLDALMHYMHGPTIIMCVIFFYPRWYLFFKKYSWRIIARSISLVAVADLITILFFVVLNGRDRTIFMPEWAGLCITALLLFSLRFIKVGIQIKWGLKEAVILGLAQGIALLPGISRFGVTYVVGRWISLTPRTSFELSFLIQWPILLLAFFQSLHILYKHQVLTYFFQPTLVVIMIVSSIIAYAGLYGMYYLARKQKLWLISLYMIIPLLIWAVLHLR